MSRPPLPPVLLIRQSSEQAPVIFLRAVGGGALLPIDRFLDLWQQEKQGETGQADREKEKKKEKTTERSRYAPQTWDIERASWKLAREGQNGMKIEQGRPLWIPLSSAWSFSREGGTERGMEAISGRSLGSSIPAQAQRDRRQMVKGGTGEMERVQVHDVRRMGKEKR